MVKKYENIMKKWLKKGKMQVVEPVYTKRYRKNHGINAKKYGKEWKSTRDFDKNFVFGRFKTEKKEWLTNRIFRSNVTNIKWRKMILYIFICIILFLPV